MDIDLKDILFGEQANSLTTAVIANVAAQIALVDVMTTLNVKADGFVGHSLGEITCA